MSVWRIICWFDGHVWGKWQTKNGITFRICSECDTVERL